MSIEYADSAQAREVDLGPRSQGYDPFHPDAPDFTDRQAVASRRQAYEESRRARLAMALGQLEEFFGARP